ncbi:uncharacterized protein [Musca autumnalis]|uniref:uncharacterized protein n=1 Tax=Musca autumnalis TaxID=221902 RepID=UPI003CE94D65
MYRKYFFHNPITTIEIVEYRNIIIEYQTPFPNTNRIHDLKSFENEVLHNIHNISHVSSNPYHQQTPYYPAQHDRYQRYRSNNDLRMDDSMSMDFEAYHNGGMGRRHPSISELLLLQRASSSQMHSPMNGSSYDLSSYRHSGMDHHKV